MMKAPPTGELVMAMQNASREVQRMVDHAKAHGPTAQFHVRLVAMSRAIDRSNGAMRGSDPDEIKRSLDNLRDVHGSV